MDVLNLFWNIWSNPQTTVFKAVEYILMMADNSSLTWAAHVRILCQIPARPTSPHARNSLEKGKMENTS
jgi:hypothetical protein